MICPLLPTCKEKASLEKYTNTCTNMTKDAYKDCPTYQKEASTPKTPLEWSKLLTPT